MSASLFGRTVGLRQSSHCPDQTRVVQRKQRDRTRLNLDCPLCIVDCTRYMGGVDTGDHYNHVRVKSRKSYKVYLLVFV